MIYNIKRLVSILLMVIMVTVCSFTLLSETVHAEDEVYPIDYEGEFQFYIAVACNSDWLTYYYSPDNYRGVSQELATLKAGDTVTVSVKLDGPCETTRFMEPVLVAEGIIGLDYEISCTVDGKNVKINSDAGKNWWYQHTGTFEDWQAIRLGAGYNEFGVQYMEMPVFTEVTYTIIVNSAKVQATPEQIEAIKEQERLEEEARAQEELQNSSENQESAGGSEGTASGGTSGTNAGNVSGNPGNYQIENGLGIEVLVVTLLSLYVLVFDGALCFQNRKIKRRNARQHVRKTSGEDSAEDIVIQDLE